ncbi:FAD-binding domain-containing protein [Lophiostoma macrostomum CBS 122681]|uniref:FAD-binding domain-containing protein n=1 Tax=Lophiostoma macrostomum CBS 122681 TaxID=1314788 RepID=A0A6A6SR14_9PLEO|nr:FAD-binding domain-containing protein [Lophiostoma macrostomum CBS 122681]
MAATLGAGEQDADIYQALASYGAVTVGGTADTVGIVGWATSGGHGWLTSSYGQGADNIYEVEVVTPTCQILVANECQNTDIFWATRGGGGGTYGIITKIIMKAYPMPQTTQWVWDIASHNKTSAKDWWTVVAELHVKMIELKNQAYDKSNAMVEETLAPFKDALDSSANLTSLSIWNVTRYDTWIAAFNALPKQVSTNDDGPGGSISVSRLLTRQDLTGDVEAVAKMFMSIGPASEESELGVSSRIIAGSMIASPKPVDASLNSAWRNTSVHLLVKALWSENLQTTAIQKIQNRMTNHVGYALRHLSPDSGCYANECDQYEPDWQWAMYGPN